MGQPKGTNPHPRTSSGTRHHRSHPDRSTTSCTYGVVTTHRPGAPPPCPEGPRPNRAGAGGSKPEGDTRTGTRHSCRRGWRPVPTRTTHAAYPRAPRRGRALHHEAHPSVSYLSPRNKVSDESFESSRDCFSVDTGPLHGVGPPSSQPEYRGGGGGWSSVSTGTPEVGTDGTARGERRPRQPETGLHPSATPNTPVEVRGRPGRGSGAGKGDGLVRE